MKKHYSHKEKILVWLLPLLVLFLPVFMMGQTTETFDGGNTTWTVPCGVSSVTVKAWGAGGGGGGSDSNKSGGSGGGGGAFTSRVLAVTQGDVISYQVGVSGGGGDGVDGSSGTESVVTYGAFTLTAGGGTGGEKNKGAVGVKGTASGGTTNTNGVDGTVGTTSGGDGGNAANTGGGGGTGGAGVTNGNGGNGNSPGGGGGGGERDGGTNGIGGDGGNGRVQFTYTPSAQEINVTGLTNTIVDGDITPTTADNTNFGTGALISKTFVIENTGGTNLSVTAINFTGANAADFSASPTSATILPCSSTSIVVTFTQGAAGVRTATMNIINNDASEATYDFSLTATGVPPGPEMDVTGNGVTIADGDVTPSVADYTDFNGEGTRQFIIYNNGTSALSLSGTPKVSIGGADAASFVVASSPDASVANADNTTFIIAFSPTTLGVKNATISITNDDASENPYDFAITATATAKEINVLGDSTSIPDGNTAHSTTDLTDYEQVIIGSSWTNTFVIQNTGSLPLTLPANPVSSNNAKFTVIQPSSLTIPGNSTYEFYVTYTPNAAVTDSATITLLSDDADEGTYTFDLEGSGLVGTVLTQPGCLGGAAPKCEAASNGSFDSGSAGWTVTNWTYDSTGGNGGGGGMRFDGTGSLPTGSIVQSLTGLTSSSTTVLISFDVRIAYNGCNPDFKYVDLAVKFGGVEYLVITRQVPGTVEAPLNLYNGGILVATSASIFAGKEGGGGCDNALWYKVYLQVPKTAGTTTGDLEFYADENNGKFANQLKMYIDNITATADAGTCGFVWLKADAGTSTTTNGASLSRWDDQVLIDGGSAAELATHPTQSVAGNQPNYATDVLNGNPGIYFDGSDRLTSTAQKNSSVTSIVVFKPAAVVNSAGASQTLLGSNITGVATDVSGIKLGAYSGSIANETYGILRGTSATGWATGVAGTIQASGNMINIYPNASVPATDWIPTRNGVAGTALNGGSGYNQWAGQDYVLGASPDVAGTGFSEHFTGHIMEVLNYPSALTSLERTKVESYLATKYGISLDKDYKAGFGATTYSASFGFDKRIFGIGREDCMVFHQRESTCESDTAERMLTIGYNSIISGVNSSASGNDLPNNAYVMIGDDNGSRAAWTVTDAPTSAISEATRIDRTFKMKITGAPTSAVRFQLDGTTLPAVAANERVAMVIADATTDIPLATLTGPTDIILPMTKSGTDWIADIDVSGYSTAYFTFVRYQDCYTDLVCTGTTKTWNGAAWAPSAPTVNDRVVLSGAYNTSSGDFTCCTLQIDAALTIDAGGLVEVQSNIINNSSITIEDGGSLMQYYGSATNTGAGTVSITRNSQPMYRGAYTYWSSPVSGFDMSNIDSSGLRYTWDAASGAWAQTSGVMASGQGYIIQTDNTHATDPTTTTVEFVGTLYNGRVTPTIYSTPSKWNLLGNPYPSALDADDFITENHTAGKTTGGLYFWTHNTRISGFNTGQTVGQYDQSDYAVYTMGGGASAAASFTTDVLDADLNDISYGGNSAVPTGYIAAGQAFFVEGLANTTVTFKNCMRTTTAGNNSNFYRGKSVDKSDVKDRFWLDLENEGGSTKQLLFGYFRGAKDDLDGLFDAKLRNGSNTVQIYTMAKDDKGEKVDLTIQGKNIDSFNENEVVPVGFRMSEKASPLNRIGLNKYEGFFEDYNIYLEDKLVEVIHDLKSSPYSFEAEPDVDIEDRFVIRFRNKENPTPDLTNPFASKTGVTVASKNNVITTQSEKSTISTVKVYGELGRLLFEKKGINKKSYDVNSLATNNKLHIVVVYLNNGDKITTKIVH